MTPGLPVFHQAQQQQYSPAQQRPNDHGEKCQAEKEMVGTFIDPVGRRQRANHQQDTPNQNKYYAKHDFRSVEASQRLKQAEKREPGKNWNQEPGKTGTTENGNWEKHKMRNGAKQELLGGMATPQGSP